MTEVNNVTQVDRFVPDDTGVCESCGRSPTVSAEKDGVLVYQGKLCGPCTWGEAAMLDPSQWNE